MGKYEFINNGRALKINTPKTPRNWSNYLFNREYYTEVSQSLQGVSMCLDPVERNFTRGYRYFFIKDLANNCVFTANYSNYCTEFDKYECIHEVNYTELISVKNGIESKVKVFVPTTGTCELWSWEIKCDDERELELYTCIGSEINGMGITCEYTDNMFTSLLFPYHIKYEEYEFVKNHKSTSFCISETEADWYNGSELDFWGSEDKINVPQFIESLSKKSLNAYGDTPPVFALGYKRILKANTSEKIKFIVGVGYNHDEIREYKKYFSQYDEEFENVVNQYNEHADRVIIETPDKTFNYMINHWVKKQTICMATTHRKSVVACTRNELQDCIGFSMFNPEFSKEEIIKVFEQQYENGYVQQHHVRDDILSPRGLGVLNHMDGAVWFIMCTCIAMRQWGDKSFLEEKIKFKQSENSAAVYEHLIRAVRFMMKNKGQHNMCLMGDGDWTDPINGAGRKGKGESTWTTAAFKYSLTEFLDFVKDEDRDEICNEIENLDEALNKYAWENDRYICGYDDDGKKFGSKENKEGSLYLNPQTWAIISQTARDERSKKCVEAIEKTKTPFGNLLLIPPYSQWNGQVGKISVKTAGTTENGSVYNHASMFKAYADYMLGLYDEAYETISDTLPTNPKNPDNLQAPLFISNFYYGIEGTPNFGQSSNHNSTGTCSWMMWLVTEQMLGAKALKDGLCVKPKLPSAWDSAKITRKYKNAVYNITILRGEKDCILVNGKNHDNEILPYQDAMVYDVQVSIKK